MIEGPISRRVIFRKCNIFEDASHKLIDMLLRAMNRRTLFGTVSFRLKLAIKYAESSYDP